MRLASRVVLPDYTAHPAAVPPHPTAEPAIVPLHSDAKPSAASLHPTARSVVAPLHFGEGTRAAGPLINRGGLDP
jgi:hypothetical protein